MEEQWWVIEPIIGLASNVVLGTHTLIRVLLYFDLNDGRLFLPHVTAVYRGPRG